MYQQPYIDEPRLTVSSVLLLAVFMSVVAVAIAAYFWQPWDESQPSTAEPAIEAPADESDGEESGIIVVPADE